MSAVSRQRASPSSPSALATSATRASLGGRYRAQREREGSQRQGRGPAREVVEHPEQGFLDPLQRVLARPAQERQVRLGLAVVPEPLHGRGAQVQPGESVGEAPARRLAPLERAAEDGERGVGDERECGAEAREAPHVEA
jgi:hypothetical protein